MYIGTYSVRYKIRQHAVSIPEVTIVAVAMQTTSDRFWHRLSQFYTV